MATLLLLVNINVPGENLGLCTSCCCVHTIYSFMVMMNGKMSSSSFCHADDHYGWGHP